MGSLQPKSKLEDKNTVIDTMNLRSTRDKHVGHIPAGVGNHPSSKKQVDNKTKQSDRASVILDDTKQCCSTLISVEVAIKCTLFSATQRSELNEILKRAHSTIERMMQTEHTAPITSSVAPICDSSTGKSETLTKVAIAGTSNDAYGLHQENECSLEVERNEAMRNVTKGKVGDSVPENTRDHTKPPAIGNNSSSGQTVAYQTIFKINSFMHKLKKGEVQNECHATETLKNFEKILTVYVNNSDQKIVDNAKLLLFNVRKANMQLNRIKNESKHSSERLLIDGNAGRNEMKQMNTDNSRGTNEKKEIENIVETGHLAQQRLGESKYGGTDDNCNCTKEQCECSRNENRQKTESIPVEQEKKSDDRRSRNEKKLKQIENRRNEIKSEIDCFVGPSSDPKFQELNEYSLRLLLEMDDLDVPKGSDLHKRKRELLKEVYQYSDILEKKAREFSFLAKVENNINYIKNHFNDIKKSRNDLNEVASYIKYVKSKFNEEDYENLSGERKQRYIEEMDGLEEAVKYIIHQENINLSLASKSEESVEDATPSGRHSTASGETGTKANCSTSNNGLNRNEHVFIDQEQCKEQSHRTENAPNEIRDIIENDKAVNQVGRTLSRQGKREEGERITEDKNVVNPFNQLQSIEGQSDHSHSSRNGISYGADTPTETELDDIIKNVIGVRENIYSFIDYAALEDYQSLKDALLREHSRVYAYNKSEVCEEISKRIHMVKKEILNWLDYLEKQIEALHQIRYVEVELQKFDQIIRNENDIQKLRDYLLYLRNILPPVRSNSQRLNNCFELIELYSNKIESETMNRNFDTMV